MANSSPTCRGSGYPSLFYDEIVWNHMLCGDFDSLWANLNYIDPEFTKKYMNSIPECVAMADTTALVIAYEKEMRKIERK